MDTNVTTNPTPKKEPSKTLIYVSNLPFDTNDEQFRDLFKGFNIKTAYVARRKNGKSKGFGFVNLEKESDQNAAIERVNGSEFNSRKLIAKVAMNDERRNEKGELKEEFKTQQNTSTPSETVLHVSNLEWSVKDEDLKKIFADFNPKVATVATRRNGRSKGFGFVEFNNKEDQEKALKLNGTDFSGRSLTVQKSTGYKQNNTGNNTNNRNFNRRNNNNNRNRNNSSNNRGGNRSFNVVRRNERRSDNTLYISNLPFELDDNDLKQIFSEFQPKNAHIPTRRNGKSKGYGFVEFNNSKDQNEALRALDQSEVNGRVVTIKVSTPNNNNNNNRVTVRRNNNNRNYNNNNNNNYNNNNNNRRYNDNNNNRSRNNRGGNNNNNNRNYNNNNNNNNNRRNNNNNDKPKEVSTNMVYVSNLPFEVDDKGLEEIFKGLKISKAYVARRRNGYSKGFGFVELASQEDQQKALKYNNNEVSGRAIVVQAAFKVENRTN